MSRSSTHPYPLIGVIGGDDALGGRVVDALRAHFGRSCALRYADAALAGSALARLDLAVLLDAGGEGPGALEALLAAAPALAVLALVGPDEGARVVELIERGAVEAAPLGEDEGWCASALGVLVEKALALALMRSDAELVAAGARAEATRLRGEKAALEERVSRLEAMAWTDPLTGLANRRQIEERLPQLFAEATRYGTDLACLMIDLDGFKQVNDSLGHAEGDAILRSMGQLIGEQTRASDIAGRYGGDEFLILMPRSGCSTAARVAERLFEAFARRFGCGQGVACGMSIGIACVNRNAPLDGAGLINLADLAMYASKKAGRNRVMVCVPGGGFEEVSVPSAEGAAGPGGGGSRGG